jgi:hypothetical protein
MSLNYPAQTTTKISSTTLIIGDLVITGEIKKSYFDGQDIQQWKL